MRFYNICISSFLFILLSLNGIYGQTQLRHFLNLPAIASYVREDFIALEPQLISMGSLIDLSIQIGEYERVGLVDLMVEQFTISDSDIETDLQPRKGTMEMMLPDINFELSFHWVYNKYLTPSSGIGSVTGTLSGSSLSIVLDYLARGSETIAITPLFPQWEASEVTLDVIPKQADSDFIQDLVGAFNLAALEVLKEHLEKIAAPYLQARWEERLEGYKGEILPLDTYPKDMDPMEFVDVFMDYFMGNSGLQINYYRQFSGLVSFESQDWDETVSLSAKAKKAREAFAIGDDVFQDAEQLLYCQLPEETKYTQENFPSYLTWELSGDYFSSIVESLLVVPSIYEKAVKMSLVLFPELANEIEAEIDEQDNTIIMTEVPIALKFTLSDEEEPFLTCEYKTTFELTPSIIVETNGASTGYIRLLFKECSPLLTSYNISSEYKGNGAEESVQKNKNTLESMLQEFISSYLSYLVDSQASGTGVSLHSHFGFNSEKIGWYISSSGVIVYLNEQKS